MGDLVIFEPIPIFFPFRRKYFNDMFVALLRGVPTGLFNSLRRSRAKCTSTQTWRASYLTRFRSVRSDFSVRLKIVLSIKIGESSGAIGNSISRPVINIPPITRGCRISYRDSIILSPSFPSRSPLASGIENPFLTALHRVHHSKENFFLKIRHQAAVERDCV